MISLDEFKSTISVIGGTDAEQMRKRYVLRFVDTESERFRQSIAVRTAFADGSYYTGYLWDCMKASVVVAEKEIVRDLERVDQAIYVMWDLHSAQRIKIPNYWKFPKEAVLSLTPRQLLAGLVYLPEDIYIFDSELIRTWIFTHEYMDNGQRFCLAGT